MHHYSLHDHQAGVENQTTNGETTYGAPPLLTFQGKGITITTRYGLAKTARGCGMRRFPFTVVLLAAAVVAVLALGRGPAESAFPGANGKIAFVSHRDGNFEIYVMNASGSGPTRLTNNPADDGSAHWSPDGSKIAFQSGRDGNWEIYVMNADGTGQTRLTNNPADDGSAHWSPDGSEIAFHSYRDGNYEIYVMNADGTGQTRLANNPADDHQPAWTPDGSKIAFTSYRDGNNDIYVMNANGTGQTRLTNNPASDGEPDWSPDGSEIAFHSDRDGNHEIYVMNADGTAQTRLTNIWSQDIEPAWQPAVGSSSQDMPVGTNVSAHLDGVSMTCSQVTAAGKATLTTTKGGPAPPADYGIIPGKQGDMLYYDISTTATCTCTGPSCKPITLCFTYDDTNLPIEQESDLKLAKHVGGDWKYLANQTLDTVNNIICGEVDSLSLFLMLGPVPVGVGGMVELRVDGEAPAAASGSASGGDHTLPAAAAAAGAVVALGAALVALGAGGWYAKRRRLR